MGTTAGPVGAPHAPAAQGAPRTPVTGGHPLPLAGGPDHQRLCSSRASSELVAENRAGRSVATAVLGLGVADLVGFLDRPPQLCSDGG